MDEYFSTYLPQGRHVIGFHIRHAKDKLGSTFSVSWKLLIYSNVDAYLPRPLQNAPNSFEGAYWDPEELVGYMHKVLNFLDLQPSG